jgi:hypothetical protein
VPARSAQRRAVAKTSKSSRAKSARPTVDRRPKTADRRQRIPRTK